MVGIKRGMFWPPGLYFSYIDNYGGPEIVVVRTPCKLLILLLPGERCAAAKDLRFHFQSKLLPEILN
jgi:hypothetical protein